MVVQPIVAQRNNHDCAIATLAMLMAERGISYEDVLLTIHKFNPQRVRKGLFLIDIIRVAAAHRLILKRRYKYDLSEVDSGILNVEWKRSHGQNHVVLVRNGLLVDALNGLIWDPDSYLEACKVVPKCLLELVD